ncbi:MAG: hypothetical protein R2932_14995 [Caldilineaceae bacterium]
MRWLWIICTTIFGLILGCGQSWSLRNALLRWRYLPMLWIGSTALAGALLGGLLHSIFAPPHDRGF